MSQPLICEPVHSGPTPFFVIPRDDEARSVRSLSPLSDGEEQRQVIAPAAPIKPLGSHWESTVRFPCKARGVSDSHNDSNAYIDIPPTAVHGTILMCSHPVCVSSGRRFKFCAVCQLPVARRNFKMRHSHERLRSPHPPGEHESAKPVEDDALSTHSVKRPRLSNGDALCFDHKIDLLVKKESSEEEVPRTVLVEPAPSLSNSEASLTSSELTFKELGELGMHRSPHLPGEQESAKPVEGDASSTHSVKRQRLSNGDALRFDHKIHLLVKKESLEEVPRTVLVEPAPSVSHSEASLTSSDLTFKELGMLRSPHHPDEQESAKPVEDDASSTHSVKRQRLSNGDALRFDHKIHLLVKKESSEEEVPRTVLVEPAPSVSTSEVSLTSSELTFKEFQWLALYRNRPSSLESELDFRVWMDAIIEAADFDDVHEDGDDPENYENYLSLFLEDVDVKQEECTTDIE